MLISKRFFVLAIGFTSIFSQVSNAGVFDLTYFVEPGKFSLGIEPEMVFSDDAGMGINAKYTHGATSIANVGIAVGTGGGERAFRLGGFGVLEIFPDVEGQVGIGIAAQTYYYRLNQEQKTGQFEVSAVPYVHKSLASGNNVFEPFVAFPIGLALKDGNYQGISNLSVGSHFRNSEHLSFVFELGIGVNNVSSYLSGGLSYYY